MVDDMQDVIFEECLFGDMALGSVSARIPYTIAERQIPLPFFRRRLLSDGLGRSMKRLYGRLFIFRRKRLRRYR